MALCQEIASRLEAPLAPLTPSCMLPYVAMPCHAKELPDKLLDAILEVFASCQDFSVSEMSLKAFDEEQELSLKKFPELAQLRQRVKWMTWKTSVSFSSAVGLVSNSLDLVCN